MTQRMSRGEADLKFHLSEAQDLSMLKVNGRFGAGVNIKTENRSPATCAPQHMIIGMQRHKRQRIQRIRNGTRAADMIEMRVRIPHVPYSPAALFCSLQNNVPIPRGVDHYSFPGFGVRDEIGVRLCWAQSERNYFKHLSPCAEKINSSQRSRRRSNRSPADRQWLHPAQIKILPAAA